MPTPTILIAFFAGIASFLAPCVLPLIPAFLGFLAGGKIEETSRWKLLGHSLLFVLGFATVFALLGVLLNNILVTVAATFQLWLQRIAGAAIIFFGLYLLGIIKPTFLEREHKFKVTRFSSKGLTSFVFGAAFAVGWTPCVGAVLGTILALAISMPGQSLSLLFAYSLGLGIPFLLAGIFAKEFLALLRRNTTFLKYFNLVIGSLITLLGILVFTGRLSTIVSILGLGGLI